MDLFLEQLKDIWMNVPDWRFMQLMSNFFRYYSEVKGADPFFMEEDKAIRELAEFIKRSTGGE